MATPVDLARGWMKKADSDRLNVNRTAQTTGPYDTACFHAQQAAEKYLKAVLALAGATHFVACSVAQSKREWTILPSENSPIIPGSCLIVFAGSLRGEEIFGRLELFFRSQARSQRPRFQATRLTLIHAGQISTGSSR